MGPALSPIFLNTKITLDTNKERYLAVIYANEEYQSEFVFDKGNVDLSQEHVEFWRNGQRTGAADIKGLVEVSLEGKNLFFYLDCLNV